MSGEIPELGGMKMVKDKPNFFDSLFLLILGFLIGGAVIGFFFTGMGFVSQLEEPVNNYSSDFNLLHEEHFALAQNQAFIIESINNSNLCGNGQFIPDSNRTNEIPKGVVYSCFIEVQKE